MTSADRKQTSPAISSEGPEEMARYGITRVPVDYFHYGKYRYTNLEDAVAQAKCQQRTTESRPAISPGGPEEMARHGITRVPVDHFHYGKYRYTNLEDAVAEAKRGERSD
jgi:hypothetical protein